jgi:hypothetical protein
MFKLQLVQKASSKASLHKPIFVPSLPSIFSSKWVCSRSQSQPKFTSGDFYLECKNQGDQIGQFFAFWAVVFGGSFFENTDVPTHVAQIIGLFPTYTRQVKYSF